MRFVLISVICVVLAASGCASRAPVAQKAPAPAPVAKSTVPTAKTNRFAMTQNGRKMTADDFDAWMKSRGIRVAKGKPAAKQAAKPATKAKPKTTPKPKP